MIWTIRIFIISFNRNPKGCLKIDSPAFYLGLKFGPRPSRLQNKYYDAQRRQTFTVILGCLRPSEILKSMSLKYLIKSDIVFAYNLYIFSSLLKLDYWLNITQTLCEGEQAWTCSVQMQPTSCMVTTMRIKVLNSQIMDTIENITFCLHDIKIKMNIPKKFYLSQ